MSNTKQNPVGTIQRFQLRPDAVYTLESAARLAHLTRRAVLICCNNGLVSPMMDAREDGYFFNGEAIRALQHIAFLQNDCGINLRGTRIIMQLMDEVKDLENELHLRRR